MVRLATRLGGLVADAVLGLPLRTSAYEVQRDLAVPVADGVSLLGDLYRPSRGPGPQPVVLIRLPYGRTGLAAHGFVTPFVRRGLQVFVQSTRGTFGSGGHFRPFTTEHDDGLATVAWLREQTWCDGRVATTGGSYFGHTQWAIAPYVDPPLVAASPHITASKITRAFYENGAPMLHTALTWAAQIGRQEVGGPLAPLPHPRLEARLRRAMRALPLQAADTTAVGAPVAFWRDFVTHAEPGDPFWSVADHDGADFSRMPPVNMVTGWWDLFAAGQLDDYRRLREAGVPARIVVGPWLHGEPGEIKELLRSDVTWLTHHLLGGPPPAGAPVRLYLQQADRWLDLDAWPPPAARAVRHHLQAGGGLAEEAGTDAEPSRFVHDPADPTPTVGGPTLKPPGKQADNRAVEARPDVLVFTGPVLSADVDVVGPVRARVHVRPSLEHADVFVRVCDVDAEGVSRNVVDGIRRLDPRTVPGPDVTVGEDGVLAVDVELFPTAYRVRAGHRLRVQVSGGAFPRFARNTGTGEPLGTATAGRACRFEVHHDAAHPSYVELPVLT
ncbi:CocE/NonD family hydrolase [Pseudonocardia sp. KRD-184]|uniref:CocE/NonD family hydrolase n=1 Tax=Pseudonocardia oceani TaxID=2792013 RepID=A0ABS6U851_9PSEU|nr:CocE/NonD family hydrolase [Pseudonocardia oceani]MBW0088700.1 CocE/NonD family hydrolase [Pseudonocardia oceani]MBW0095577.1 CocE/NonD family hydrolase [Pseudonocardia oceani]MBW0110595.1 CocE/NonD family hydrolase [Pseudonocardia oceani]MBW0120678.1 CocE/NonD family hydrolase [Pseudonocardia oceani]MBW0128388.1 CocE/NonD family hydrolase [Pseudonocardia oceani]